MGSVGSSRSGVLFRRRSRDSARCRGSGDTGRRPFAPIPTPTGPVPGKQRRCRRQYLSDRRSRGHTRLCHDRRGTRHLDQHLTAASLRPVMADKGSTGAASRVTGPGTARGQRLCGLWRCIGLRLCRIAFQRNDSGRPGWRTACDGMTLVARENRTIANHGLPRTALSSTTTMRAGGGARRRRGWPTARHGVCPARGLRYSRFALGAYPNTGDLTFSATGHTPAATTCQT